MPETAGWSKMPVYRPLPAENDATLAPAPPPAQNRGKIGRNCGFPVAYWTREMSGLRLMATQTVRMTTLTSLTVSACWDQNQVITISITGVIIAPSPCEADCWP